MIVFHVMIEELRVLILMSMQILKHLLVLMHVLKASFQMFTINSTRLLLDESLMVFLCILHSIMFQRISLIHLVLILLALLVGRVKELEHSLVPRLEFLLKRLVGLQGLG